jgi:4-hydroxyproline epimerase
VRVDVHGHGPLTGDVAWGGNWFFLVGDHGQSLELRNVEVLTDLTWRIRLALVRQEITGKDGAEIDHVELFSPSTRAGVDSRNFVLCPGKAYDRSPCGTGTSAKLACLFADAELGEGETWRQESIVGSVFEGSIRRAGDHLIPTIRGSAYVTAEATLVFDPRDPFKAGIRA